MSAGAIILVASEGVSDAELVRKLLRDEFDDIRLSTDPERAVEDFENHRPALLILAFDALEKAERYYLGLYRRSDRIHGMDHRTIILCHKDDLKRVYELCKREYFDDYILFWPVPHDALRLPMTVHHALRQMAGASDPTAGEIAAQARRLQDLEAMLVRQTAAGGRQAAQALQSAQQAEAEIINALDGFYADLTAGRFSDLVEIRNRSGLQQEFGQLKKQGVERPLQTVDQEVRTVHHWVGALQAELAPQLESVHALQALAARIQPVVLVVDDDEFQHKLLGEILAEAQLDTACVTSGTEALGALRRRRPDLILMDINLSGEDGLEVTRRIKSVPRYAEIPIIMITGKGEKNIVMDSLRAGAVDFIVKPFNRQTLLAKLRKVLAGGKVVAPPQTAT